VVTQAYQFDVAVRPYTLRSGDTLKSIAQKRGQHMHWGSRDDRGIYKLCWPGLSLISLSCIWALLLRMLSVKPLKEHCQQGPYTAQRDMGMATSAPVFQQRLLPGGYLGLGLEHLAAVLTLCLTWSLLPAYVVLCALAGLTVQQVLSINPEVRSSSAQPALSSTAFGACS
jgi:hypothetical protein